MAQTDFLEAIDVFAQSVRRARGAPARETGLSLSQYALLIPLAERQEARIGELAAAAGITPSTATRIMDALERRGLVSRERASEDRRAVSVSLTHAGRALLDSQDEWVRDREKAFYAGLPGEERALAPDLLRRLATLIDELAAGPG
jgi:DNA-binding MarR family transcriptional regulator